MKWKGKINFETRPEVNSNKILSEAAGEINLITSKTTPANADLILIEDSAASNAKKKVTVSSIKGVSIRDEGTPLAGTPHNTLNFVGSTIAAADAGSGIANITVTPIFGSQYNIVENAAEASTTSTSPVTRLTLSPTGLPSGTYRVGWFFNWSFSSTGADFRARITVNGTEYAYMSQEPKDAGTDQNHPASGFFPVVITTGSATILLQYWVESGGTTAYMRNARIEFWRIS
jgi:hypothetical protein